MKNRDAGLSLVEVIIAIAVVGIVVAVISTATLSSVRNNATSGGRTQATQVLNYLGRLVAGGDPVLAASELVWDYGELDSTFRELATEAGRADPDLYRAEVEVLANVALGAVSMPRYRVNVCWMASEGEACVTGETIGPELIPTEDSPGAFPGIG